MCRVYLHEVSMRRLNQNIGKKHAFILVFEKVTQLVARALVAIRKKKL